VAIPDFQTLMLPFLRLLGDGREHRASDAVEVLNEEFGLSLEERQQRLATGPQTVMRNRTGWVCTYLKKAALIESPIRGTYVITKRGLSVLASNPERIDVKYLEQFPEFVAFRELRHERSEDKPAVLDTALGTTPEEALDSAYQHLRVDLELEVLEQVKMASPAFFERLVVELLVRMGYGGSLQDAGQAVGRSGDGGIDGIIKEDRLGLDVIYIQAKRWDSTVGRPEIQKFAGALQGHRARKGVSLSQAYEVKKIDSDYFLEE
jgi:restriction system protein